ncbi:MAG TPA: hypothetical protein V6C65_28770 [Allocoleopsis sp.]
MASHSFPLEKVIKLEFQNDTQHCNLGFEADGALTKNLLITGVPAAAASAITAYGVTPQTAPPYVYVEYQMVGTNGSFDTASYAGRIEIRQYP